MAAQVPGWQIPNLNRFGGQTPLNTYPEQGQPGMQMLLGGQTIQYPSASPTPPATAQPQPIQPPAPAPIPTPTTPPPAPTAAAPAASAPTGSSAFTGSSGQPLYNPQGLSFAPSQAVAGGPQGISGDLYNNIMSQVALAEQPVDQNDPIIKAQTDAAAAQAERGVRSALSREAEAQGPNANLSAVNRSLEENASQGVAGLTANLMSQERQNRSQQLLSLLSQGGGLLTQEQQMQIQDELNKLQLAENESQYARSLAEQGLEFGANLDFQYAGL